MEGHVHCKNQSEVKVVFWNKGDTASTVRNLAILDLEDNGSKSGKGYEDGSHDIAANFSLVIKSPTSEDGGRYFCEVIESKSEMLFLNSTFVNIHGNLYYMLLILLPLHPNESSSKGC